MTDPELTPQHNFDRYEWGGAPYRADRLYQGPFPKELASGWQVVMSTMPSAQPLHNTGMGLVNYVLGDLLPLRKNGESVRQTIEKIAQIPMGDKLYIRPSWRQMQPKPGELAPFEHWQVTLEMAAKYNKRVGFRIMLSNPDSPEPVLPDFILEQVPQVKLEGEWPGRTQEARHHREHYVPRYDHPAFLAALRELDERLAEQYNGHPLIEFVDTSMYGFWGEGHTWPYENTPFTSAATAVETWTEIFEMQRSHWTRTPLVTNTQPDINNVGNAELVERTVRSGNWLRTDTIFIENQQIEAISNRPPWVAAVLEVGMSDGTPESLRMVDGAPHTENIITHVKDVGANYWSLWNWHNIHADHVMNYYRQYPEGIDTLNRQIGYRVRPSWVWEIQTGGRVGLVLGMVNDGIAGVPGVLHLSLLDESGQAIVHGTLDPGYPLPGKVRQARLILPEGVRWEGLRLKAEIEIKEIRYPVQWACREATNPDGTLTLMPRPYLG